MTLEQYYQLPWYRRIWIAKNYGWWWINILMILPAVLFASVVLLFACLSWVSEQLDRILDRIEYAYDKRVNQHLDRLTKDLADLEATPKQQE